MKDVIFITGNQSKADYLAKYLGHPVPHKKVDQDEIQSLDLREIVAYKAKQAFAALQTPVLVTDVSLEFAALGKLPGAFIKFFLQEMPAQNICQLVDGKDRSATARSVFGYYDGQHLEFFEGSLAGTIAEKPAGSGGFGWDEIFIPEGYTITRAEMDEADDKLTYLQINPLEDVKAFLLSDETV